MHIQSCANAPWTQLSSFKKSQYPIQFKPCRGPHIVAHMHKVSWQWRICTLINTRTFLKEASGHVLIYVLPTVHMRGKHKQQKVQCAKAHLHYYCCIKRTTNMGGRLFLEGWRQRDYCWRSRPPASSWLANRWPLCRTWTTGQHYLHIKSLSEQESLSLHSPVSLILKEQLVYFMFMYWASDV